MIHFSGLCQKNKWLEVKRGRSKEPFRFISQWKEWGSRTSATAWGTVKGNRTSQNIVEENYWDRYSGFDRNNDNIGDNSYKIFQYADQLWHYNHKVKFFYAAPVMSMLNFILNLAPFIEPVLLLEDKKPIVKL